MKNKLYTLNIILIAILQLIIASSCSDDDNSSEILPVIQMMEENAAPIEIKQADILVDGGFIYQYTLKLDISSELPMLCRVEDNADLVDAYNEEHGSSYKPIPSNIYSLIGTDAIIKAGELESNALYISFSSLYGLELGEKYLLPIVAILDETSLGKFEASGKSVLYFSIIPDSKIDYIVGLDMRTFSTAMYTKLNFPDGEIVPIEANTHTFEILVYPYSWHTGTNYLGTWIGYDTNNSNEAFSGCELRTTGTSGASNIGNRQCDLTLASENIIIPPKQWNLITVTCDGTQTGQSTEIAYKLYLNGELLAAKAPTKRYGTASSQRFKVGYTISGIQLGYPSSSSYYFYGLVSEIRMWKKCLTEDEIKSNLREIVSPSANNMFGYWKINEGTGNVLKDSSGNGRDLTFGSSNILWGAEYNSNLH